MLESGAADYDGGPPQGIRFLPGVLRRYLIQIVWMPHVCSTRAPSVLGNCGFSDSTHNTKADRTPRTATFLAPKMCL